MTSKELKEVDPIAYETAKWRKITDWLQGGSLAGVFIMIIILELVPRSTAKILVWPLAATILLIATAAFFAGNKFMKAQKAQFAASEQKIKDLFEAAIKEEEKKTAK